MNKSNLLVVLLCLLGFINTSTSAGFNSSTEYVPTSTEQKVNNFSSTTSEKETTTGLTESGNSSTDSTSSSIPTTTLPPPSKVSEKGSWKVKDGDNICLMLDMATCFRISYDAAKDTKRVSKLCVPKNSKLGPLSGCENDTNVVQLLFGQNFLTLNFDKKDSDFLLSSGELKYQLDSAIFEDTVHPGEFIKVNFTAKLFKASLKKSYKCKHEKTYDIAKGVTMVTENVQAQAFRNTEDKKFSKPTLCDMDKELDYLLPIISSAILGTIVVIVLIIYCIARFRISRRNYTDLKS